MKSLVAKLVSVKITDSNTAIPPRLVRANSSFEKPAK